MDLSFSSSSSSSSSSDEELLTILEYLERPRVFRPRPYIFEKYGDREFRRRYRLSKETVQGIIAMLEDGLAPETLRNHALSAADQVLTALHFYATGSLHMQVGDDYGIHKSTVSRVVKKVSIQIAALRPQFIKLPKTAAEMAKLKANFQKIRGFPDVLGCVDGTHVPIMQPGRDDSDAFINSQGYFSLNVQAVCDPNLLITNIVARWPGSVEDDHVWNSSLLAAQCAAGEFGNSYFLGDSAYTCGPYLLTPVLNPSTYSERNYNRAHTETRNCIERCLRLWKQRFTCLSNGLRSNLDTSMAVIVATTVLHNIAILQNDPDDFYDSSHDDKREGEGDDAVRRALIETVFR